MLLAGRRSPCEEVALSGSGVTESRREQYKQLAAETAVTLVEPGMIVGLGTGTTAAYVIRALAAAALPGIRAVATSTHTEQYASSLGIPMVELSPEFPIDLTLDGADEIDPGLDLVKGAGGALLREKMVAEASRRLVIVADEGKLSPALGSRTPIPVEVVTFGWQETRAYLCSLGAEVTLRRDAAGNPVSTDQGNYLLDCRFARIEDPHALAARFKARAGVIEHGLFLGLATSAIVAGALGVKTLSRHPD